MDVNSSLLLQKNIKDSSEDLQEFLKDLNNWEKDIKLQDEKLSKQSKEGPANPEIGPPVRCKKKLETSSGKGAIKISSGDSKRRRNEGENLKKKKISAYDYAAWDKFDVDKALVSSSEEEEMEKDTEKQHARLQEGGSEGPRPNKKEQAVALKDAGNKFYSQGQLNDAVAKYTQAMALDPTNAILPANRAMAYIKLKKYTAAESDCNRSLKLDAGYIKAYLRRATACINLGKTKLAVKDYKKVLQLEPWNKEAKKELEKLEKIQDKKDGRTEIAEKQDIKDVSNQENVQCTSRNIRKDNLLCEKSTGVEEPVMQEEIPTGQQNQKKEKLVGNAVKFDKSKSEECGKKLNIVEVNSNQDTLPNLLESDCVLPLEKPPHLRSQKPLRRIQVTDVPTRESIQKLLNASPSVEVTRTKSDSHYTDSSTKSVADASSPLEIKFKTPTSQALPSVPKTSHQFEQDWNRLCGQDSQAIKYLKIIQPTFFSSVDLEVDTFIGVVSALKSEEVPPSLAAQYIIALSRSSGFAVNVMFLNDKQRKVLDDVIMKCEEEEVCNSQMKKLKDCLA